MNGPVVDLLNAVDWVVPELGAARERLLALLPDLEPTGELHIAEHDFATLFLRGSAAMAARPTRIQLVTLSEGGAAPGCAVAPFAPMQGLQGTARRQRIHGTVVAVRNFDEAVAWLSERGVPVFVEHTCAHLPYLRAWVGWAPDGRERIEGFDAGLFVELIPIEAFPRSVGAAVSQPRSPMKPPTLAVTGRLHLVDDLDAALTQVEGLGFGLPTMGQDALLGVRTARWSFRHPGSGDLLLGSPKGNGPAVEELAEQGPGTWLTTLACADVQLVAEVAVAAGAELVAHDRNRWVVSDPETGIRLDLMQEEGDG